MDKDTLISQQALKIAELEEKLERRYKAGNQIHNIIYCIGGPLNDNKLGYTKEQMVNFAHIIQCLNEAG